MDPFNPDLWENHSSYYLNKAPQSEPAWEDARKRRLTTTKFASCAGFDKKYTTREDVIEEYKGHKKPFTAEQITHIARGKRDEPKARFLYESRLGIKVKEVGLAVPKWDTRLGGSSDGVPYLVDGEESEGIVEIKSPERMYSSLEEHLWNVKNGIAAELHEDYPFKKFSHIPINYYCQILGMMAIMGKKWCDFVVYCEKQDNLYIQRIVFDESEWAILYEKLLVFLEENSVFFD